MSSVDLSAGRTPQVLLRAAETLPQTGVVLIDGPSGAGKSTLADLLVAEWPGRLAPTLVRMDDIYPGWNGLDAGVWQLERFLLVPRQRGEVGAWQRYDWATEAPGDWNAVPADRPLIVEGCGTLAAAHEALSDIRVWIDADDRVRKQRALDRDGDVFRAHWDQWDSEWHDYVAREQPVRQATLRLTAGVAKAETMEFGEDEPNRGARD